MCFMYRCVLVTVNQTALESWNDKIKTPLWGHFLSLSLHIPGSHTVCPVLCLPQPTILLVLQRKLQSTGGKSAIKLAGALLGS